MKSQRRQNQSRKTQQRNKNNNRRNQNKNTNNQNRSRNANNCNRKASQKSKSSTRTRRNTRSQKRLQKNSRNNRRVTRKNQRSQRQRQRRNKNKKSQRGGYGTWSLSDISTILPCRTENGVSVANFDTSADAGSKICSNTLDMLVDSEFGADSAVSVISDLSDFAPGETTQVIDSGSTGDGRTMREARTLMDNISAEAEYQNLGRMVAPYPTRNAAQDARFAELGQNATARWNALRTAGYAGPGSAMPNPVATSPA